MRWIALVVCFLLVLGSVGVEWSVDAITLNVTLHGEGDVLHSADRVEVQCVADGHVVLLRVNPNASLKVLGHGRAPIRVDDQIPVLSESGDTYYVALIRQEAGAWSPGELARSMPSGRRFDATVWEAAFGVPVRVTRMRTVTDFRKLVSPNQLLKAVDVAYSERDHIALRRLSDQFVRMRDVDLTAEQYLNIGSAHAAAGQFERALESLSVCSNDRSASGVSARISTGFLLLATGRLDEAISLLCDVLKQLDEIDLDVTVSRRLRADCEFGLCDAYVAKNEPERAVAVAKRLFDVGVNEMISAEDNLACELIFALNECGKHKLASEFARRFTAVDRRLPTRLAACVAAELLESGWQGDLESLFGDSVVEALAPKVQKSICLQSQTWFRYSVAHARESVRLAETYLSRGEMAKALECFRMAASCFKKTGYRGMYLVESLLGLAELAVMALDPDAAVEFARNAVLLEQSSAFSSKARLVDAHLMLAVALFQNKEVQAAREQVSKALQLLTAAQTVRKSIEYMHSHQLSAYLAESDEERSYHHREAMRYASIEVENVKHPRFLAEEAKVGLGYFLSHAVAEDADAYAQLAAFAARTEDASLPWDAPGSALIDVFHYRWLGDYFGNVNGNSELRYVAFVRLPGGVVRRVELGAAAAVDENLRQWRTAMSDRKSSRPFVERMVELVWGKLSPHLPSNLETLYVCADWELGAAPWETLPADGGRQLIDEVLIRRVPASRSGRLLHGFREAKRTAVSPQPSARRSMLLVGDVQFGRPAIADPDGMPAWPPLPGTAKEVQQISQLAESVTLLQGVRADKQRVVEELPTHAIAHFATHGYANAAWVRPSPWLTMNIDAQFGMVLARANEVGEEAMLSAADVGRMRLPRLNLAVLSGCETGIGQPRWTTFLSTLHRAFHQAGAPHVLASMWRIDDQATEPLIGRFYHYHLKQGWDPGRALRAAQLDLRNGTEMSPVNGAEPSRNPPATRGPNFEREAEAMTAPPEGMAQQPRLPDWAWAAWYVSSVQLQPNDRSHTSPSKHAIEHSEPDRKSKRRVNRQSSSVGRPRLPGELANAN